MARNNIDLLRQALSAAESSLKVAKQLLTEIERGSGSKNPSPKPVDDVPGIIGVFDGENMITKDNQTFPVPSNYASKSMLIPGDTLKLIEEGKEKRFKQIDHVKRYKTSGILAKKDGKWSVLTPEGSYKVLPASVSHFGVDVGNEVSIFLPDGNLTVSYAAIESVKTGNQTTSAPKKESVPTPVVAAPPAVQSVSEEEKKPEVKKEKVEAPKVEAPKVEAAPVAPTAPPVAPKPVSVAKKVNDAQVAAPKTEVKEEKTKEVEIVETPPAQAPVSGNGEEELT